MSVHGPLTIEQYEHRVALKFTTAEEPEREQVVYKKVSEFVRENIGDGDEIYDVSFQTDPLGGNFWGFSGYVIARDECVIHVGRMAYTN